MKYETRRLSDIEFPVYISLFPTPGYDASKLNSFGIKHLVALNLILLVKTLVKESVHEALYLKKYYPVCNYDYLTQLFNELN